jgi:hypothetical protein
VVRVVLLALKGQKVFLREERKVCIEDVFAGTLEECVAFLHLIEVMVVAFGFFCVDLVVLMLKIYSDCSCIFLRMSACSCLRKSFILRRRTAWGQDYPRSSLQ